MSQKGGSHEDFTRKQDVKRGSERSFGLVFAGFFAIVGVVPFVFHHEPVRLWSLLAAVLCLIVALLAPKLLKPFNAIWFQFGLLLHKITNPLIMGLMFFVVITPAALLMRLFGKDPLRLRKQPDAASYWIVRHPPGPAPESMRNQF